MTQQGDKGTRYGKSELSIKNRKSKYEEKMDMRKIIAYIAMSLDGYISDEKEGVSWLSGDGSEEDNIGSYPDFIKTVDTVILGYKTYYQIMSELSPDVWPYAGKKTYVLTHKELDNKNEIVFTSESIMELAGKLNQTEGKNIWICGGSSIINQFHHLGLIDEYCISIIPTILGKGTRLFEEQDAEQKLKFLSLQHYNGIVDVRYEKRK